MFTKFVSSIDQTYLKTDLLLPFERTRHVTLVDLPVQLLEKPASWRVSTASASLVTRMAAIWFI